MWDRIYVHASHTQTSRNHTCPTCATATSQAPVPPPLPRPHGGHGPSTALELHSRSAGFCAGAGPVALERLLILCAAHVFCADRREHRAATSAPSSWPSPLPRRRRSRCLLVVAIHQYMYRSYIAACDRARSFSRECVCVCVCVYVCVCRVCRVCRLSSPRSLLVSRMRMLTLTSLASPRSRSPPGAPVRASVCSDPERHHSPCGGRQLWKLG